MQSCPHNFRIYRNVLRQLYIAEFPISAYIQKKKHALAQKLSYAAITGEKGPSAALAIQLHGQRTANRACLPRQDRRAKAIQRGTPPNPARVGTTDVRAGVGQGRRIDRKPGASWLDRLCSHSRPKRAGGRPPSKNPRQNWLERTTYRWPAQGALWNQPKSPDAASGSMGSGTSGRLSDFTPRQLLCQGQKTLAFWRNGRRKGESSSVASCTSQRVSDVTSAIRRGVR